MPDIAIRTTFIVGFPGETERHFEHLLEFVKAMRFDRLGVFVFSPEPGTLAANFPNPVPSEVAEERRHRLLIAQQAISQERNEGWVGKELEVVLERWDRRTRRYQARSQYEAPDIDGVVLVRDGRQNGISLGSFVRVRVERAEVYDLHAAPIDDGTERRQGNARRRGCVAGIGV
jgi:ribosomal protein S12 methylthiotransferase